MGKTVVVIFRAKAAGDTKVIFALTKGIDRSPVFRAARGLNNKLQGEKLAAMLRDAKPRAVVCTHFLPLEVALHEKRAGRLDAPIYAVVTDYVAQDGSNNIAVTADVEDLNAAQAMMASPPPEVAAKMEEHGVIPPLTVYIEA